MPATSVGQPALEYEDEAWRLEAAAAAVPSSKKDSSRAVDDHNMLFFYQAAESLLAANPSVAMGDLEYVTIVY